MLRDSCFGCDCLHSGYLEKLLRRTSTSPSSSSWTPSRSAWLGWVLSSKTPWPSDFLQIKHYLNWQSKMIRCIWKPLIHNFMTGLSDGSSLLLPVLVHYFKISLLHYSCSARHKPLVMHLSSINHSVLLSWRFLWDPAGPNYICRHLVGEVQPVRAALSFLYGFLSLF